MRAGGFICKVNNLHAALNVTTSRRTLRAVDAAGAARGLGAILKSVLCQGLYHSMEVASGATDALRWAAKFWYAASICEPENLKEPRYYFWYHNSSPKGLLKKG